MDDMTINVKVWVDILLTKDGRFVVVTYYQQEGHKQRVLNRVGFNRLDMAQDFADEVRKGLRKDED